jgi:hypothetical protein
VQFVDQLCVLPKLLVLAQYYWRIARARNDHCVHCGGYIKVSKKGAGRGARAPDARHARRHRR